MRADPEALIAEQLAFYRADARAYEAWRVEVFERGGGGRLGEALRRERGRVLEALRRLGPLGDVLELAAGTGAYTSALLASATHVTALDASPESLALARTRLARHGERVGFLEADLFAWRPPRRYDSVFFAYWLSHVPPSRFDGFWRLVADALRPRGRVFLVDSTGRPARVRPRPGARYREHDDAVAGVSLRELDGRRFRVVKVVHEPAQLTARLAALGWRASLERGERSLWGTAVRAGPQPRHGGRAREVDRDPGRPARREVQ